MNNFIKIFEILLWTRRQTTSDNCLLMLLKRTVLSLFAESQFAESLFAEKICTDWPKNFRITFRRKKILGSVVVSIPMDPIRIEWITTSRGKKSPILDGFQFRVNKHLNNGKSYWKCVRTDVCSVTLVTNEDRFWSLKGEHPHGKNDL